MTKRYLSENDELMKEWDFEANKDLNPDLLTYGSNKKVWWICHVCNGKWQATISDRTRKDKTGCPYCASQKVLHEYNDLVTKYPNVAKQWHPAKNILKPTEVMPGSSKRFGGYVPKVTSMNKLSMRVFYILIPARFVLVKKWLKV